MIAFAIAALLLIMLPGPDQALIMRNALVGGRMSGMLIMIGGALGVAVHAAGAAVGLSALLVASSAAFSLLKAAGALYLAYLGIKLLRPASRSRGTVASDDRTNSADATPSVAYLRQGFLSNALNPKVALFFVTLLPQFIATNGDSARLEAIIYSATFAIIYLVFFSAFVMAIEVLGAWLRRPQVQKRLEQVTGAFLLAAAARLALPSR